MSWRAYFQSTASIIAYGQASRGITCRKCRGIGTDRLGLGCGGWSTLLLLLDAGQAWGSGHGLPTAPGDDRTTINVIDFALPDQAAGNAAVAVVNQAQRTVGQEIILVKRTVMKAGYHVAGPGIPPRTVILRALAVGDDWKVVLSQPTTRALHDGDQLFVGPTDDTSTFAAAVQAANRSATSNVVLVPRGVYILDYNELPVTYGRTTWKIDPGAAIYGADIPGFWGKLNFASGYQGLALGRNDVTADNSNILYLSQNIGNTGLHKGVEKNVLDVDCTEGDALGRITGDRARLGNIANASTACIGYHAEVRLGNAIHGGSIWASQYNVRIPAGTDGYAVALEYGLENGGEYAAEIGQGDPKVGIKAICSGPKDCTTANEYESAGGLFHMFERFYQPALRPDGWAWIYEAVGYVPLADVDYRGNLYAQTLRAADMTVASLPHGCEPGQIVHAVDGRKPGEPLGDGSGVDAECERVGRRSMKTAWFSMMGGGTLSQ